LRLGGSNTNGHNNVTVRGQGPMSTTLTVTGSGWGIDIGACCTGGGSGALTSSSSNYLRGQTTVKLQNVSGTPAANNTAYFVQCDNGYTPASVGFPLGSCTGAQSDPLGVFHCSGGPCSSNGGSYNNKSEVQTVRIVSATNTVGNNWTVTVTPGLYMQDWSHHRGATLAWDNDISDTSVGIGLEDMTIKIYDSGQPITVGNGYASWMKGVRILGYNNSSMLTVNRCSHCLLVNNYLFAESHANLGNSSYSNMLQDSYSSDTLILNNIGHQGLFMDDAGNHQGLVIAYNYGRDAIQAYYQATQFEHSPGSVLVLREGNQFGRINDDSTNGSHTLNTFFRNNLNCGDYPFDTGTIGGGLQIDSFARFANAVGNAIGFGMPSKCQYYQAQADDGYVFNINGGGNGITDTTGITEASLLRWGNVSTVHQSSDTPANSGIRFVSSEIPTNLSTWPNSVPYENSVPVNSNLPCSFFLQGYSSTSCTPKYSGGTGFGWWKVCDTWSTFPTSCSHYTTPPFPSAGPDIKNYANDIPAALAWKHLPIDSSFQNSYTVTDSGYDGTNHIETLTVSGLPGSTTHILGGFQLQGAPSACNPSGDELLMTGSDSTHIKYALDSDPGTTCDGTVKWPDVRKFDESVYQSDSAGLGVTGPNAPTGLAAAVN